MDIDWCARRESRCRNDLPMDAVRIGHIDGDLFDSRLAWAQFSSITTRGAVLVRGPIASSAGTAPEPRQTRVRHWSKALGKSWATRCTQGEQAASQTPLTRKRSNHEHPLPSCRPHPRDRARRLQRARFAPTDAALTRQCACPRRARGAEQISQSGEKVGAEQCRA
jgi:hypothetical protein